MSNHVQYVSQRLSLRKPQREALEMLEQVCGLVPLKKGGDPKEALAKLHNFEPFKRVEDFERDFPSLCFALATGVGKTRLMGAFIGYLHRAHGIRHFFVLAPNLTIYNKLTTDFTAGTRKYVLNGLAEFATNPPEIITGDNYEGGRGVRRGLLPGFDDAVHINIFNISKINSEVRGDKEPRIKRLSEYIGESYFSYLSKLDDLVLLMDESHRYRASAGVKAINELRPLIGLELTATPQVEKGNKTEPFKNVIYSYPLSEALKDGFVKEPTVATRLNFRPENYGEKGLEELKLKDGVLIHEHTKAQLAVYASENNLPVVKPFMLVVADNTDHADALRKYIEDAAFFDGAYKGKVITVHSNVRGEDKDETIQQLLTVEDATNPTEIVIHVNMLKEGWDVTNLYTIVPLRAANSKTLVEQSIGRGLRLPYGKRVGNADVDRLTIVSHDRFQEIVNEARDPNSIIKKGIVIGLDIPAEKTVTKTLEPRLDLMLGTASGVADPGATTRPLFEKLAEVEVARVALEVIQTLDKLPSTRRLSQPEIHKQIVARIEERLAPAQRELIANTEKVDIAAVAQKTAEWFEKMTVSIPRITVVPKGAVRVYYDKFDLEVGAYSPKVVAKDILLQSLQTGEQDTLVKGDGIVHEDRIENYIVGRLLDLDDVDYEANSDLLFKLAGQMIAHLKTYLKAEEDLLNVLQYHKHGLAQQVHTQLVKHRHELATGLDVTVSRGFKRLTPRIVTIAQGEKRRDFRQPVEDKQNIRRMMFGGFKKCLYDAQKFDSDPERRFAVLLEKEPEVERWFRPSREDLAIDYSPNEGYEADFVVECRDRKLVCEVKAADEIDDEVVKAKAEAARLWCERATAHEKQQDGGKPWKYLLVPDNRIAENITLASLE